MSDPDSSHWSSQAR